VCFADCASLSCKISVEHFQADSFISVSVVFVCIYMWAVANVTYMHGATPLRVRIADQNDKMAHNIVLFK